MKNKKLLSLIVVFTIFLGFSSYGQSVKKEASMLLENERNSISIFQTAADSIINVTNLKKSRNIFDMDSSEVEAGMGSGIIWDKQGYVVTNFHVVDGGDSFNISFKDDKVQYKAKLIGADPKKDLAVLKLVTAPKDLKPITPGESRTLQVGQKALAIGSPLGLDHTLTTGSVSALNRKIVGYGGVSINDMIQTDAAINPGNSGGALLDSQGKLIGINTMIFNGAGAQSSAGLGFAIPIDIIKSIIPQLIKHGKVIRPGLGIAILEEGYAYRWGLKEGVMIKYVDPKGPAAKAGLRGITRDRRGEYYFGDVIIGINSDNIKTYDDLFTSIDKYKIGDTVTVKYLRENKEKVIKVNLTQL